MSRRPAPFRRRLAALACAASAPVLAQTGPVQTLPTVVVQGQHANDTASQGSVTARLVENRPAQRPAEPLPGGSSLAAIEGARQASLLSPQLSLVFGPWRRTELFAAVGNGLHSNDARGAVARNDDPLVRSRGEELGLRTEPLPGLQSSLALWRLRLASELLFVGDAGETEPQRASRRAGIEWNNRWVLRPGLLLDADLALTRSRFVGGDGGTRIPGSIARVVSLGLSATELGPWFGHLQLRHLGTRPLVEDDTQRSGSTTLVSLRAGRRLRPGVTLTLDVFNLFDRRASDIGDHYASRLPGEPAEGVADRHFHPVEPRSLRLTLDAAF